MTGRVHRVSAKPKLLRVASDCYFILTRELQVVGVETSAVHWVTFDTIHQTLTSAESASIPGPYPTNPPLVAVSPDSWYVVDCGREVGIFADK